MRAGELYAAARRSGNSGRSGHGKILDGALYARSARRHRGAPAYVNCSGGRRRGVLRATFHCDFGYNISLGPTSPNFQLRVLYAVACDHRGVRRSARPSRYTTADHPRDPVRRKPCLRPARYRSDRTLDRRRGDYLAGAEHPSDAVVWAGAVVTRDVPQGRPFLATRAAEE